MNNIANTTTLWQLLGKCKVVIPILQRDYAQGRVGYESLREKFLLAISAALNGDKQLKLDFVYGSSDQECRFNPLDGQQRLTTLWLLHWYLAFRLGKLSEQSTIEHLSNFSYETRVSSTSFCQRIVKRGSEIVKGKKENIAEAIIRQTWVPSVWRQDPTVQSMLRMLSGEHNGKIDGIEELFADKDNQTLLKYWDALMLPAAKCPLVFYQLDLENLGQSDDLYVKMNGRGKPLSDFENFKADLIKYIADQEWTSSLHAQNGLPILLDTKWLDFFWKYRNSNISLDDMMFGFINRFLLVRLMMAQIPQKIEDRDMGNSPIDNAFKYLYSFTEKKDARASYNMTGFGVYQTVFEELGAYSVLYDLRTLLENLRVFDRDKLTSCVSYPYEDGEEKFEVIYTSGKNDYYILTIPETIAFWAVCQFFLSPSVYCTEHRLRQWMRVVWNVCNYQVLENSKILNEIRSKTQLRSTIISLHKAFPYKWDVHNVKWFVSPEEGDTDKTSLHIVEEQAKIRQFQNGVYKGTRDVLQGQTWETIICSLEKLPFFRGTIRALFTDGSGKINWSLFDTKHKHLYWYLNSYGDLNSIAHRNLLLYHYDFASWFWYPRGDRRNATWRSKLPYYPSPVDKWLMATPLDHFLLSTYIAQEPSYAKRCLIQTALMQEVTDESGMYASHSYGIGCDVYWHHQNSSSCIIFNECRDIVVRKAVEDGLISLCDPNILKPCGLFFARDIVFTYQGITYNWHAKGIVYRNDNPERQLRQPDSVKTLLKVLTSLADGENSK